VKTLDEIIRDRIPEGAEFCIYSASEVSPARVCLSSPDRRQYIGREGESVDEAMRAAARDYRAGLRE
jgi:hypothetical protein